MSLLMERSQENTVLSKLHTQQLRFYMANSRKEYTGVSIDMDTHL